MRHIRRFFQMYIRIYTGLTCIYTQETDIYVPQIYSRENKLWMCHTQSQILRHFRVLGKTPCDPQKSPVYPQQCSIYLGNCLDVSHVESDTFTCRVRHSPQKRIHKFFSLWVRVYLWISTCEWVSVYVWIVACIACRVARLELDATLHVSHADTTSSATRASC